MKKIRCGELYMNRFEYEVLNYKKMYIRSSYLWIRTKFLKSNTLAVYRCEMELLERGFLKEDSEKNLVITSRGYDAIDQYERDKIEAKRYTLDKIALTISVISILTSILAVIISIISLVLLRV